MENNGSIISREKIDQMATWLGSTVSSAFFSSLERFSCVNVTTSDPDDEDDDDYSVSTTTNDNNPSVTTNDVANLPV
ncbi:uncharacterized protein LOC130714925 [Lotus japonicus]|uniref:uncharacterized protein LOC130714925 n=1 Tax=Lotus japonicus TaxID=34305 RepID=UPI002585EF32|nr:uncharacterized protein LOC130714925 [Lotus japonicus]XP_057420889.1 uncharacterized protein LOC130714925 [Lotus japonicus]